MDEEMEALLRLLNNPKQISVKNETLYELEINGQYYLLGSIQNEEMVKEIDNTINEHKNEKDFLIWLESYKEIFKEYQKESENHRRMQLRENSKGYYYFKSRNCWKSHIKFEGVKICLGYFKDEYAASYIYQEATLMIQYGLFKEWIKDLKNHQQRIKGLFEC